MKITIHQKPADLRLSNEKIKELCAAAAGEMDLDVQSCCLVFLDDAAMRDLHEKYLNDPSATDVITFDMGDEAVEGEIYLCPQQAKLQAYEYGVSFEQEVLRLIIHALLHLKGYNDIDSSDYKEMKEAENRLVDFFSKKM